MMVVDVWWLMESESAVNQSNTRHSQSGGGQLAGTPRPLGLTLIRSPSKRCNEHAIKIT